MKLELTIPTLTVFDTIVSGVEGGIQYWAKVVSFSTPARTGTANEFETDLRLVCDLVELETGERIALREQWAAGLRLMAERYPRKFAELVDGTGDATTGDVLYARVVVTRSRTARSANPWASLLKRCA
jgi:hypothetical protein